MRHASRRSSRSRKGSLRNVPNCVGRSVSTTRRTSVSLSIAIANEIGDRDDLEAVFLGKHLKLRHPRHRAVVVHDLADHRRRLQARDPRAISTLASVCPTRTSTPPRFARSGNTCPGPCKIRRLSTPDRPPSESSSPGQPPKFRSSRLRGPRSRS